MSKAKFLAQAPQQQQQQHYARNMQILSKKSLSLLNTAFNYKREDLSPGILHFSTGNFHRAHQAAYYHDLFNLRNKDDNNDKENDERQKMMWGVRECSVRQGGSYTEETRPALEKQDYLYTLSLLDDDKAESQVIGSIIDMLPYQDDHQPIKDALLEDQTKIVSMTVTEGGYFLDPSTNEFDAENDEIQYDANHPEDPQTVFGLIIQALRERRDKNQAPFTVMSCDNVPGNGDAARQVTVGLAKLMDKDLASWIDDNVQFPNSMVDRITPSPTEGLAKDAGVENWDYQDDAIVFSEPFRQWICEDKFCNDQRPALEKVGVKFVADVIIYENMKLRILNGGHASLCYPAALLDIEYVHDAMAHDTIGPFVDKLQQHEIVPNVPPVPETDLYEYWATVRQRFQNSKLSDRIDRNCKRGSQRQPKFILPSIQSCLRANEKNKNKEKQSVHGLATVSALWCRYCQGQSESGQELQVVDSIDNLQELAQKAKENDDPMVWLNSLEQVYGDIGKDESFQKAFNGALNTIHKDGVEAAMKRYINNEC